jgi:DNA-binding MarR family transcriptional regulator
MQRYVLIVADFEVRSKVQKNAIYEVVSPPFGLQNTTNAIWINASGQKIKVFEDEFEESTEKEFIEKSLQDSKTSINFIPSVNSQKTNKMAKTKNTVQAVQLTKTEMAVMQAIAAKGKIGALVDLDLVAKEIPTIDAAKVSRKLKRAGLVEYIWNEDRSRSVSITELGQSSLELPVKEKAVKAAESTAQKKEVAKTTKAPKAGKGSSIVVDIPQAPEPCAAHDSEQEPEFLVKSNPVTKTFTIMSEGVKYTTKAGSLADFKAMKEFTQEEWQTRIANGELTEA